MAACCLVGAALCAAAGAYRGPDRRAVGVVLGLLALLLSGAAASFYATP